jgi:carboxypeptidase N regulatory subunit
MPDDYPDALWTSFNPNPLDRIYIEVFHPSILTRFPNLTTVTITRASMNRISQNSFERCENLEWIMLEENLLEELPVGALRNCRSLNSLILRRNRIASINPNAFAGLSSLQTLELDGNRFTSIDAAWFTHFPTLTWLRMRNNPLREIQPGTLPTNLGSLSLERCEITQLHPDLFKNFTQLWNLDLNSNPITELPIGIFSDLESIRVLDLSGTNIRRLNSNSFGIHRNVTVFWIPSSGLDEIQPGFFDNFLFLQTFFATGNRCMSASLSNVHTIDFEQNRVLHQCFANWFVPRP